MSSLPDLMVLWLLWEWNFYSNEVVSYKLIQAVKFFQVTISHLFSSSDAFIQITLISTHLGNDWVEFYWKLHLDAMLDKSTVSSIRLQRVQKYCIYCSLLFTRCEVISRLIDDMFKAGLSLSGNYSSVRLFIKWKMELSLISQHGGSSIHDYTYL